jgi:hypothetical protein
MLSFGVHKVVDTLNLPDDVQKFERAIVSGKPFKTDNTNRRLAKSSSNVDNANESSGPGSESESAGHEPPKVVSCKSILVTSILIFVRITRGEVSWHSYRTKAPRTTSDFYIPRVTFCLMFVAGFSLVPSPCSFEIPEVLLIPYDYQ